MEATFAGGGGIVISTDPSGSVHLLLAQESSLPGYKASRHWSGFEGGVKDGEKECQCCMREMYEESLGLFGGPSYVDLIKRRQYEMRLEMHIHDRRGSRVRVAYVFHVPFNPSFPQIFESRRQLLLHAQSLLTVYHQHKSVDLPMCNEPFDGAMVASVHQAQIVGSQCMVTYCHACTDKCKQHVAAVTPPSRKNLEMYCKCIDSLNEARKLLAQLPSPLAKHVLQPNMTIRPDFLEKQRISYWTQQYVADLLALRNKQLRKSALQLRHSFVPLLRTAMLNLRVCAFSAL